MKKIGMGLVGPGFVAGHHIDAVRRLGDVDVVAIAGSSQQSAEKKAREYKVDRAYGDYKLLIADPDIQVIHNTTPNHLHLPVTLAALQAGKHVISDKHPRWAILVPIGVILLSMLPERRSFRCWPIWRWSFRCAIPPEHWRRLLRLLVAATGSLCR
jgi:Oxidoreductase family, NAD-binding Rossmann fold